MIIKPHTWYSVEKQSPILSVYKLLLSDGVDIVPGYYYNNRFYIEDIDVTDIVKSWYIDADGEEVQLT